VSHRHRFRLTANLALSPPDTAGYVRKLFIRECPLCPGAEVVHGVEHVSGDEKRNRLTSWEEWNALGWYDGNEEDGGVHWEGAR